MHLDGVWREHGLSDGWCLRAQSYSWDVNVTTSSASKVAQDESDCLLYHLTLVQSVWPLDGTARITSPWPADLPAFILSLTSSYTDKRQPLYVQW